MQDFFFSATQSVPLNLIRILPVEPLKKVLYLFLKETRLPGHQKSAVSALLDALELRLSRKSLSTLVHEETRHVTFTT
jgi:hypothetical protein